MADYVAPYFPPDVIVMEACRVFAVPVRKLRSRDQRNTLCCARNLAALLLSEHTVMSQGEIAKALGRNHSTAGRELLEAGRKRLEQDPRFRQTLENARQRLLEGNHA